MLAEIRHKVKSLFPVVHGCFFVLLFCTFRLILETLHKRHNYTALQLVGDRKRQKKNRERDW